MNFFSECSRASGYGGQGTGVVMGLARAGVDVRIWPHDVGIDEEDMPDGFAEIAAKPWHEDADFCLVHSIADVLEDPSKNFPDWRRSGRKVGLWSMFEWDRLPGPHPHTEFMPFRDWTNLTQRFCDFVVVPAKAQVAIFRDSGVTLSIHVVHDGVDVDLFRYSPPRDEGPFRWIHWGVLNSRKCPIETVRTFLTAFPRDEFPDVSITLKTVLHQFGCGSAGIPKGIEESDPRIRIVNALWSTEEVVQALHDHDGVIYLSRGDGAGNCPQQGLSVGRPVVASSHSGLSEFVDDRFAYPVRTLERMENYPPKQLTFGYEYHRWTSDYLHAAELMRRVVLNRREANGKARAGSRWVRENWTFDHTVEQLLAALRREL